MKIHILRVIIVCALFEVPFVCEGSGEREVESILDPNRPHHLSSLSSVGIKGVTNIDTLRSSAIPVTHLRGANSTVGRNLGDGRHPQPLPQATGDLRSLKSSDCFRPCLRKVTSKKHCRELSDDKKKCLKRRKNFLSEKTRCGCKGVNCRKVCDPSNENIFAQNELSICHCAQAPRAKYSLQVDPDEERCFRYRYEVMTTSTRNSNIAWRVYQRDEDLDSGTIEVVPADEYADGAFSIGPFESKTTCLRAFKGLGSEFGTKNNFKNAVSVVEVKEKLEPNSNWYCIYFPCSDIATVVSRDVLASLSLEYSRNRDMTTNILENTCFEPSDKHSGGKFCADDDDIIPSGDDPSLDSGNSCMNYPDLDRGSPETGYVMYLQNMLNNKNNAGLVCDGIFGGRTRFAVLRWQRKADLQTTGVVDGPTWESLCPICEGEPLSCPLNECEFSSPHGMRIHPIYNIHIMHDGVDYRASTGDPIYPAADGVVENIAFNDGGYGYYIILRHADDSQTLYAHLNEWPAGLSKGDRVYSTTQIGVAGSTGASTAPHLHFEYATEGPILSSDRIDPIPCISKSIATTTNTPSNSQSCPTIGGKFLDYMKAAEGYIGAYPYQSLEGGNPTVGYGHKLTDAEVASGAFSDGLDMEAAEALLIEDIEVRVPEAIRIFNRAQGEGKYYSLPLWGKRMLIDKIFQAGGGGLATYVKMMKAIADEDKETAVEEMLTYYTNKNGYLVPDYGRRTKFVNMVLDDCPGY